MPFVQNDGAIAADGSYLGLILIPHGAAWRVLKRRDEQPSSSLSHFNSWRKSAGTQAKLLLQLSSSEVVQEVPRGSWELVSATISTDAVYQSALFALTYWLNTGPSIVQAGRDKSEMLVAMGQYVSGLQFSATILDEVKRRVDVSATLTYPRYDMHKNAALAAMQVFAVSRALDNARAMIGQVEPGSKMKKSKQAKKLRAQIARLLVEMRARNDPHSGAFQAFIDQTLEEEIKAV